MNLCNNEIHDELILLGNEICTFCDELLVKHTVKITLCCENRNLIIDNSKIVCNNCGVLDGFAKLKEYIDYHENKFKIKRKSVYHRKYHIINKLDYLSQKYNIQITSNDREKMVQIFKEINKILPQINNGRKRIININYILRIQFEKIDIKGADQISVSSSKKTISCNDIYWKKKSVINR